MVKEKYKDEMKNNNSQFFGTRKETSKWLDEYGVSNYIINDDLRVDVDGHVDISHKNLKIIPVNFRKAAYTFWCNDNNLRILAGSPETVGGSFWCRNNKLMSLGNVPKFIGGFLGCESNPLASLFEIVNCNFKKELFFNIDENNFQQKELIQILKKYYNSGCKRYELTKHQFYDIIKPQIEKEILDQKLNNSKIKNQTKISFI